MFSPTPWSSVEGPLRGRGGAQDASKKYARAAGALQGHRINWKAFEARGWEVVTPTICCDILRWDYRTAFPPGRFDFVWASPVCTEYSQALTTRPRRFTRGMRWCFGPSRSSPTSRRDSGENPQTGLLKTRPFMQRLGFVDAAYCLYGTPFKKQTRFWTNMRWAPSCGLCGPGNRCEAWENGRHARAAQRGPRKIRQRYENVRRQSRELLYSIPAALCDEIAAAASET